MDDDAARFELRGLLGRGGMGRVLRAFDRASGREVALKLMPLAGRDATQLERFRREGEVTARLDHPGIVRVHSAGLLGREAYLAYELVEGARALDEAWEGQPRARRVGMVLEAARALAHAHERGVVHRDVKPGNVLVDGQGRVRVTDFGLARATGLTPLTREGALMGTPFWLAPEGFHGRPVSTSADVWALGVMLYQALTDALPFNGSTMAELGAKITSQRPLPPRELDPGVPAPLEAVCLLALEKEAARRPADAGAFAALLEDALAGRHPAGAGAAAGRLAAAALVGLAALAALLVWVLLAGPGAVETGAASSSQPSAAAPAAGGPAAEGSGEPEPPRPAVRAVGWALEPGQRTTSRLRFQIDRQVRSGQELPGVYTLDLEVTDQVREVAPTRAARLYRVERLRLDARMGVPLRLDTESEAGRRALGPFLEQPLTIVQDPRSGRILSAVGVSDARQQVLRSATDNFQSVLELVTSPLEDEVFAAGLSLLWGGLPEEGDVVEGRPWQLEGRLLPWSGKVLPFACTCTLTGQEVRARAEGLVDVPTEAGKLLTDPRLEITQRWGEGRVESARAEMHSEERWPPDGRARVHWLLEYEHGPAPRRR